MAFSTFAGAADSITGVASVVDGDTIEIHGERIRFHGIDAPESWQLCMRNGEKWRCGQAASFALADLIGRGTVRCELDGRGSWGRLIGRCFHDDLDLNGWMVSEGWAMAYRKYSDDYVREEEAAMRACRNIWQTTFSAPWDARKGKNYAHEKLQPAATCSRVDL